MRLPLTDFPTTTTTKKILAFFNPQVIVMRKITKKKKGLFFIKTDCRIYGCICFELEEEEEKLVLNILLWTSFIAGLYVESLFDKIIKYVYRTEEKSSDPITFAGCEIEENEKVL